VARAARARHHTFMALYGLTYMARMYTPCPGHGHCCLIAFAMPPDPHFASHPSHFYGCPSTLGGTCSLLPLFVWFCLLFSSGLWWRRRSAGSRQASVLPLTGDTVPPRFIGTLRPWRADCASPRDTACLLCTYLHRLFSQEEKGGRRKGGVAQRRQVRLTALAPAARLRALRTAGAPAAPPARAAPAPLHNRASLSFKIISCLPSHHHPSCLPLPLPQGRAGVPRAPSPAGWASRRTGQTRLGRAAATRNMQGGRHGRGCLPLPSTFL